MSDLQPSMIVLDKGLNLQVPKIVAPPGTVLDTLNYEQVDFQGQKRIDGYVRYDGSLGSYQDEFYLFTLSGGETYAVGDVVFKEDDIVGVIVAVDDDDVTVGILDHNLIPQVGDVLSIGTVALVQELKDFLLPDTQYTALLNSNTILRDRVTELPGPVAGLHWFRDRLYAVASVLKVDLGSDEGYRPNDTYELPSGLVVPVLKVDGQYLYLGTTDLSHEDIVGSDMASFFQSRSEQQALDELADVDAFGWSFVHQGWLVPFENAVSLYGSLPSLNQNIQGVGVQGPTPTSGNNGRPLVVKQKVLIEGKPAQVNGWKGSDTPTNYSLNPANIAEDDSLSIYADAFISWNSGTGTISAPGLNGTIPEYSPTATVQVKV